jgi:hypothetical protein
MRKQVTVKAIGSVSVALALALVACGDIDAAPGASSADLRLASPPPMDPGREEWVEVPASRVRDECGLDPFALAQADLRLGVPWAVVRYGKLCHSFRARDMLPEEAFSVTKLLGGVVTGAVAQRTRALPVLGRKTGPLDDLDRVDHWLDDFDYNPDAQLGHLLGMVAHNPELTLGRREMYYDAFGVHIDTLGPLLSTAIAQDSARLGTDLDQFTHRFLFDPLGMTSSSWGDGGPDKVFAYSWTTTVFDMARLGLLILRRGQWSGEQLVEQEWIYRMTHPSFEDANTGWGYLTWLNASSGYRMDGVPFLPLGWSGEQSVPRLPGRCAPVAIYDRHPHGLSEAPDCGYRPATSCAQTHDVGVWQGLGLFGQVIQGHPALDMVIVAKNVTGFADISGMTGSRRVWDAVRPAVVRADPIYRGDEAAFCRDYGRGDYAPDYY